MYIYYIPLVTISIISYNYWYLSWSWVLVLQKSLDSWKLAGEEAAAVVAQADRHGGFGVDGRSMPY